MGTIITYRSTVDPRYLSRKDKRWLEDYINDLDRALDNPRRPMLFRDSMTQAQMAAEAWRLVQLLPPPPEGRLWVGERVDRDKGGFYIPVIAKGRDPADPDRSNVIFRVSSDAFAGDEGEAKKVALIIATTFNAEFGDTGILL